MEYKTDRIRKEYEDKLIHPMLWLFLRWFDVMSIRITGQEILITCLNRTVTENAEIGGQPNSSHCDKRAADIRTAGKYGPDQISALKHETDRTFGHIVHFVSHTHGTGPHIHVNINYEFAYGFC